MKYLKQINEMNNNYDYIIANIKNKYNHNIVLDMYTKEIEEWTDKGIEWYEKNNNGEAQEIILDKIINWYNDKYDIMDTETENEIREKLKQEFSFLY
ncbi:MAG: hypothetical protein M0R46_07040 [Candidatus Muirbacterium halophilum]|nr:hypothetical protein [Candidatus Muirbacterium halophilum]